MEEPVLPVESKRALAVTHPTRMTAKMEHDESLQLNVSVGEGQPTDKAESRCMVTESNTERDFQRRQASAKVLEEHFPRVTRITMQLLETFIRKESKISLQRSPLLHFSQEQVILSSQDILQKLNRVFIDYLDFRDTLINLASLYTFCEKKSPEILKQVGCSIRKLIIMIGELGTTLETICQTAITNWMQLSDEFVSDTPLGKKHQSSEAFGLSIQTVETTRKLWVPKISDFRSIRLLGAGGFGAVYKATYVPAQLIVTVKLVSMDRFSRQKQACADKVVASVVNSRFVVKYYCCFSVRDAYVTIMEYIRGVDVMRVVNHAGFLKLGEVRHIIAQLILAMEHLHLRGFIHRDIKVSNMLIMVGGHTKLIDFDTNKVCLGHFARRHMRSYFTRTAAEFHDSESAGSIPYMAPEIFKTRPYGRSVDWWSLGIVFYKLSTGRVPFRGKTKQVIRDLIVKEPLSWPKRHEQSYSANAASLDMIGQLLNKNPVQRLASRDYNDVRNHFFLRTFNWALVKRKPSVCNIPTIVEVMKPTNTSEQKKKGSSEADNPLLFSAIATSGTLKKKLQVIDKMTEIDVNDQKPLFTFCRSSFRKLLTFVEENATDQINSNALAESDDVTQIDMNNIADECDGKSPILPVSGCSATHGNTEERNDVILFRRKIFFCYWSYGVDLRECKSESDSTYYMVNSLKGGSPAQRSQLVIGDFVIAIDGESIVNMRLDAVHKLLQNSGDQVILTVLATNPFRRANSCGDFQLCLDAAKHDTLTLAPIGKQGCCFCTINYGLEIVEQTGAHGHVAFRCHLVKSANEAKVLEPRKLIFPADVILVVNDVKANTLSDYELRQHIAKSRQVLKLTIGMMSPLRQKAHHGGLDEVTSSTPKSHSTDRDVYAQLHSVTNSLSSG